MKNNCFFPADVLLPKSADMTKWAVVACDQFTSEPEYWERADQIVGDAPSTLRMIIPEVYLEEEDVEDRIVRSRESMNEYVAADVFKTLPGRFIYVERTVSDGSVRKGLMGMVDLETYDFAKGSQSLIRATEGTVLSRIPPRVRVREGAKLELPHVMLLIDDGDRKVIEPIAATLEKQEKVYDFELMQGSGNIRGWALDDAETARIDEELAKLACPKAFAEKYGVTDKGVLLFAVGDGNHSLATAKTCYENLKKTLTPEEAAVHPARYALVELGNVHDESLHFEPIHRVLFDVDAADLIASLKAHYETESGGAGQCFTIVADGIEETITVKNPPANLAVGTVQLFLDKYLAEKGGKVDYIHGDDVVRDLGCRKGNVGIILPAMDKNDLFKTVILDGALPRKTFSMGHACDKRFYLEARAIR